MPYFSALRRNKSIIDLPLHTLLTIGLRPRNWHIPFSVGLLLAYIFRLRINQKFLTFFQLLFFHLLDIKKNTFWKWYFKSLFCCHNHSSRFVEISICHVLNGLSQHFANSTVVITIWFGKATSHWVECCLMCFITFVRPFWHSDFDYGLLHLPDLKIGLTAGVTGRHGMLTLPRHLIPPLVCPGVRVCPIFRICISYGVITHYAIEIEEKALVIMVHYNFKKEYL
jgi:hypothetical protein